CDNANTATKLRWHAPPSHERLHWIAALTRFARALRRPQSNPDFALCTQLCRCSHFACHSSAAVCASNTLCGGPPYCEVCPLWREQRTPMRSRKHTAYSDYYAPFGLNHDPDIDKA